MKDEIYVNKPLSFSRIMELLDQYPDLKKISCPPSLYSRISPKYIQALNELGVTVVPVEKKGRPKKYNEKDAENIRHLLKSGNTPKEIAETLNIPLKTVYYLKESPLKRGRKIKYDTLKVKKVKNLYKNGVPAKDISKDLKIPLRTVYSLLKR
ncbi:helix-turn-helix domain-containing protein [Methanobacterium sp.]|uniref:helix-turn-helix domain-containing protein n=1 Tax=Methanobacterium sp. TaxID=2164 RepID=UPI0025E39B17|nr:helix-turn-helix domain-containing protein [Methanobacterium sp.]MBI5459824.1 helix-turn-helix domain-containing protein [Methanobacterium sp.]MDY9923119.1 helix-turn-helix domain-containing protein [Methanobacterium sp.]